MECRPEEAVVAAHTNPGGKLSDFAGPPSGVPMHRYAPTGLALVRAVRKEARDIVVPVRLKHKSSPTPAQKARWRGLDAASRPTSFSVFLRYQKYAPNAWRDLEAAIPPRAQGPKSGTGTHFLRIFHPYLSQGAAPAYRQPAWRTLRIPGPTGIAMGYSSDWGAQASRRPDQDEPDRPPAAYRCTKPAVSRPACPSPGADRSVRKAVRTIRTGVHVKRRCCPCPSDGAFSL